MISQKKRWILDAMLSSKGSQASANPNKLTSEAAYFMAKCGLAIRNTYTKQLLSFHYKIKHFPETHSVGGGQYCVPLWTIAIPGLKENAGFDAKETLINAYIHKTIRYYNKDNTIFMEDLNSLSAHALQNHLDDFLNRIKSFLAQYVVLGMFFEHKFDYELIVSSDQDVLVSNVGEYSTGGRCHRAQNIDNIVYRVTLNEMEVNVLKDILRGQYDASIAGINTAKPDVAITARQTLARLTCVEIISQKLVQYLNAAGSLKKVISLNKQQLASLVSIALVAEDNEVKSVIDKGSVHYNLQADELINSTKYAPTK